ncbi:hypothetical protein DF016_10885 [Burkholderia stagnalis]|uniref:KfrA N-terminal DNA-binding domain-containing protein n=1 Tax=Burkholderia stagnalis TaxID=1503054 RepID=A0ABX9YRJ3_9BURK|nr:MULTISPECIES: hypothetical protein [Burkholderia]MDD1494058.1 hypothetical protein [Burkholderia thailandensis]RQY93834.1 hypothetical protein DF017_12465 [Burkholderia stagnalis]RQZ19556.1 hypothetical protein DF016_10885 [Burkholderia stagnalis]
MPFFTPTDHDAAEQAMLDHPDVGSRHLRGLMSGIKRRARARAVIAFVQALDPPPPDVTITSTRQLMRVLFGHAVSVNDLHRHFATPGRRANDRADPAALAAWLADHRERLAADAEARMVELEIAWQQFTATTAAAAGAVRTAGRAERRGDA